MEVNVGAIILGTFAAIGVCTVLLTFMLMRARSRSRLERRIAIASGKSVGGKDGPGDTRKSSQKRLLMASKLDKAAKTAKGKAKADRQTMRQKLDTAGMTISIKAFYAVSFAIGFAAFLGCLIGGVSLVVSLLGAFTAGVGLPRYWVSRTAKKRKKKFVERFADSVDIIVRGVQSGLPLNECLEIIAREQGPPVSEEFKAINESMRLGLTLNESMQRAVKRMEVAEFRFFSIVLAIQQETGGNLAETLGNLSEILRARKKMKAKVSAMASEATSTAMIIGCLPFLMTLLLFVASPDYIMQLFITSFGQVMIAGGLISMGIGSFIMAKMIDFKI